VRCDTPRAHGLVLPACEDAHVAAAGLSSPGASLLRGPSYPMLSMTRWWAPLGTRPRHRRGREIRIPERLAGDAVDEMRGDYATNRSTNRPLHQGGHGQGIYR